MAGQHPLGLQLLDHIQRGLHLGKGLLALKFRENHAKPALPQGIGRNQQAPLRLKQNDRMRIMPRGRMHLPIAQTQLHGSTRLHHPIRTKLRAELPRRRIAQAHRVPRLHQGQLPRCNPGLHLGPSRLQRSIATAMVAVQMGVHNVRQRLPLQRLAHPLHGGRRLGAVTGIDHGGAPLVEHDVVGTEPTALHKAHFWPQGAHGRKIRHSGAFSFT